jgi:hypothetical protein
LLAKLRELGVEPQESEEAQKDQDVS